MARGINERTCLGMNNLSRWNSHAVVVDKDDIPNTLYMRATWDYFKIKDVLPASYLELMSDIKDYLSNPNHGYFMQFDIKHAYWSISIFPPHRHILAFYADGLAQLQPTRLSKGLGSSGFSIQEVMFIVFGPIPAFPPYLQQPGWPDGSEPSLLEITNDGYAPPIKFYFDDAFNAKRSWEEYYDPLEQYILPRFLWSKLCLSFKKVKMFMDIIEALGTNHKIHGFLQSTKLRSAEIMLFPTPEELRDIQSLLATVGICRRFI